MNQNKNIDEKNYKKELIEIIGRLITNIRLRGHEPELNAEKIMHLQQIKKLICSEKTAMFPGDKCYDSYLDKINHVCQTKRNVVHYWSTPHHVKE